MLYTLLECFFFRPLVIAGTLSLLSGLSVARQSPVRLTGTAMATTYEVIYTGTDVDSDVLQNDIDSLLTVITGVFSTYDPESTLAKINASRDTTIFHAVEEEFAAVFNLAYSIYQDSNGAFDPAIGPLTLAWGIAAAPGDTPDDDQLARLRTASNMRYFKLSDRPPWTIKKSFPEAALDYNGIAKGYAVDKISEVLRSRGLTQFLVELGGEIRAVGTRSDNHAWQIAIEHPFVSEAVAQTVLSASDISVATSGNYRSVRYAEGRKIVHTIQPRSGLPEFNDLLSVTVLADDCATADAYATALMVMGSKKAKTFLIDRPFLDAYLMIGQNETPFEVYATPGFRRRLVESN